MADNRKKCNKTSNGDNINRRTLLTALSSVSAMSLLPASLSYANPVITGPHLRKIPRSSETLPAVGMGTWISFNVGDDTPTRDARTEVLRTFFQMGGTLIDSSPMYGSAQEVIGYSLKKLGQQSGSFAATKVWTWRGGQGATQMEKSRQLWGVERFDLMMIHNLVAWEKHLETLLEMKANKQLRYIGITTSHGRRHSDFLEIMKTKPIDFVQFTYNIEDREAEQYLLPMAQEHGLGVIINRPFQGGSLFDSYAHKPLPDFAKEFNCQNWAQFFLKFIIAHPAVTCAIPATSQVEHMKENMGALHGRLPDAAMRKRMVRYLSDA